MEYPSRKYQVRVEDGKKRPPANTRIWGLAKRRLIIRQCDIHQIFSQRANAILYFCRGIIVNTKSRCLSRCRAPKIPTTCVSRHAVEHTPYLPVNHRVFTVISIKDLYAFEAAHLRGATHDLSDGFFATTITVSSIDWPATFATGTPDNFGRISFEAPGVPACFSCFRFG